MKASIYLKKTLRNLKQFLIFPFSYSSPPPNLTPFPQKKVKSNSDLMSASHTLLFLQIF